MSIQVALNGLTGLRRTETRPADMPLGELLYRWDASGIASIEQTNFILRNRPLESYGLSTPLADLAEGGQLRVMFTWRLSGYPLTLGLLSADNRRYLERSVRSRAFSAESDERLKMRLASFDALVCRYGQTRQMPPVNEEDPITFEPIARGMRWIEGEKVFAMEYDSLVEYARKFYYIDQDGRSQIPNPFTRQPIPEPWRTDFLALRR